MTALLVFPPLGSQVISTSDEARFPLLARDAIARGAWFDAEVRDKVYRNKPPLYPWSIAAVSLPGGRVTEGTAQAPVAAAAVGAALFTFLLGDRLFTRRAGLWAALILATSYSFFGHSQKLLPDMLVVAFATAAGYAFWRAMAEPPGRGALIGFYAALAFGVFAKGPVGLLPLLAAAAWLWIERGPRGLRRLWSPPGAAVFAVVTLSWLGAFLAVGTRSYVETVLWKNWLDWFLGVPLPSRLANLAVDAVVGFLPWTVVAPLAFAQAFRAWRASAAVRFAVLWFAVPLFVIALSANQRTRYLLSIYPGLALLVAWWADAHGAVRTTLGRVLAWGSLLGAGGGVALLALSPPFGLERVSWELLPLIAGTALLGLALWRGLQAGRPALLVQGVVAGMVVILGSGIWLHNAWANRTEDFKGLSARVERHVGGAAVAVFGGRFFPLDFYLGRDLRRIRTEEELEAYLARPERPAVVVAEGSWRALQGKVSQDVRVLDRMRVRGQEMLVVRADSVPSTR
ncbi:MAG: glycosyltransferase family 39 protein [Candidatus Rokubacteria bacterium]|nr:glycosyltransferase family 39 protein [Candidatus Rokubacteria bacterium]